MPKFSFGEIVMTIDGQTIGEVRQFFSEPSPEEKQRMAMQILERERDAYKRQSEEYESALKQLGESAFTLGVITSVDGDRVKIRIGAQTVDAAKPKCACRPGDFVRIVQPSNQVYDVTDAPRTGQTATVKAADAGRCEVSIGGSSRVLVTSDACGELKAGDTIVVDDSGSIALGHAVAKDDAQVFDESTGVTWDDIGGQERAKEAIREAIEYPVKFADLYKRYGKQPSKGVLLYGPAGTGKTLLAKATATALQHSGAQGGFLYVKGPELLNKYVGATEDAVRSLFLRAKTYKRETGQAAVMFIDEADAILMSRGSFSLGGMESTVVPAFLAEMDGLSDSGAFVMLSTNRPDTLDPAIVRDGRIDRKIKVERPDKDTALQVLQIHLRKRIVAAEPFDIAAAAARMFDDDCIVREIASVDGRSIWLRFRDVISGATIAGVVNRATDRAIRRDRDGTCADPGITAEDLRAAVDETASEMADTDLRSEMLDVMIREVGQHVTREHMGHSSARELN